MQNITMFVDQAGKGIAPSVWRLNYTINIQRLYYIKSGTGYIIGENGKSTRFKQGCVYIFPHNLRHQFTTIQDDPIDHIYFDFLSTPPIISNAPIVYEVRPTSAIANALTLLDGFLALRQPDGSWLTGECTHRFGYIADAPVGSISEKCQIVYSMLHTLLMLLSRERELPFATDRVVVDTLEYIRNNYAGQLSVDTLAARCGFETNYFIRRFRRIMGLTPYAYLRSYRLLRASELISQGETVAHAAELVGYDNASSLSRALKSIKNGDV